MSAAYDTKWDYYRLGLENLWKRSRFMPFLSPNQHCQSCEWNSEHCQCRGSSSYYAVAYPNSCLAYPNEILPHVHHCSCWPTQNLLDPLTGLPIWKFLEPPLCQCQEQEGDLSQKDRATYIVSWNLVNCCATVRRPFCKACSRWVTLKVIELPLFYSPYSTFY